MTFTLADLLATVTPESVFALVIAGVVTGWFVIAPEHNQHSLGPWVAFSLLNGVTFLAVLATGRYLASAPEWERPLGSALLWVIFAFAQAGSASLRMRRWRSAS